MSNNFMSQLKETLEDECNRSITENGAVGYRTAGKGLIDINYSISSFRDLSEEEIAERFKRVFVEDELNAIKWLFFAGDVREGVGERRLFCICIKSLVDYSPALVSQLIPLIPEYTRWDNLLPLLETPMKKLVVSLIRNQIANDIRNMKNDNDISLLAKWMPSVNASSSLSKKYSKILVKEFGMTDRGYRKMLSELRSYLKVVEVSMSAGRWHEIDYNKVPSRANLIYQNAFILNDEKRRLDYLDSLVRGKSKINASVLFPHDIVTKYTTKSMYNVVNYNVAYEELWKALPDYVNGNGNTICVSDGSASMEQRVQRNTTVTCLDVALGLTIYFSERCSGKFKNKYITFSERPQYVDLSSYVSLKDKLAEALKHDECANTNIKAVFDMILKTAIKNNLSQEELPKNILVLSDMEFDNCVVFDESSTTFSYHDKYRDTPLFDVIRLNYEEAGYKLPRLVFWNICSRSETIPVKENENGVALVSGFSPMITKMVLSDELDPALCLMEQLNSPRYDAVQVAYEHAKEL